jgi:hypothetical protein
MHGAWVSGEAGRQAGWHHRVRGLGKRWHRTAAPRERGTPLQEAVSSSSSTHRTQRRRERATWQSSSSSSSSSSIMHDVCKAQAHGVRPRAAHLHHEACLRVGEPCHAAGGQLGPPSSQQTQAGRQAGSRQQVGTQPLSQRALRSAAARARAQRPRSCGGAQPALKLCSRRARLSRASECAGTYQLFLRRQQPSGSYAPEQAITHSCIVARAVPRLRCSAGRCSSRFCRQAQMQRWMWRRSGVVPVPVPSKPTIPAGRPACVLPGWLLPGAGSGSAQLPAWLPAARLRAAVRPRKSISHLASRRTTAAGR